MPYSSLKSTAQYYRDNPKAAERKKETDSEVNARPDQRKKRSKLITERRKRKIDGKGGKDVSHTKDGLKLKPPSVNRGSKTDTQGDNNARGGRIKRYKK